MGYKNKEDQRAASRRNYEKHRKKYISSAKKRNSNQYHINKEFVNRVKSFAPCVDCGEGDPIVLDFDHVRGEKRGNVSDMVRCYYSIDSIKDEMRKCQIRCANCHRKRTFERRNS